MPDITQTESGKAWEYGLARKLADVLDVQLVDNGSSDKAQESFEQLPGEEKNRIDAAAGEAVCFLQAFDVRLLKAQRVVMQSDMTGREGDVRDLLAETPEATIGISAKHRHSAIKHSRLSDTIDFGEKWNGKSCSDTYWQEVKPIFQRLREMQDAGKLWRDLPNKEDEFYLPILKAFIKEQRKNANPAKLVSYLVGRHDFYKVIKANGDVLLHSFNMYGGLEWGKKIDLPARLIEVDTIRPGSKNTAQMTFDKGWQVSFRLHSAASEVEPSLKFDVQLVGTPTELTSHTIPYDRQA